MRIISGKYKGRQLVTFKAEHIRPTTDRVKESLFNILQDQWELARVLDLFAGTGNLGFEALSRGAGEVQAVEMHSTSVRIIRDNQRLLGVGNEYRLFRQDVLDFLKKYQGPAFDIILIDPPFTKEMADEVMAAVEKSKVWGPSSVVAIESARREKIEDQYGSLGLVDRREYGDKLLSLFSGSPRATTKSPLPR